MFITDGQFTPLQKMLQRSTSLMAAWLVEVETATKVEQQRKRNLVKSNNSIRRYLTRNGIQPSRGRTSEEHIQVNDQQVQASNKLYGHRPLLPQTQRLLQRMLLPYPTNKVELMTPPRIRPRTQTHTQRKYRGPK